MGLVLLDVFNRTSVEDTVGYLVGSLAITDMGGLDGFLRHCFDGTYAEAKQNPLLYLLLYPFAEPSMEFFAQAKLVVFIIGGLCVASVFFIAARIWNFPVAYLSSIFLCFGLYFRKRICIVNCEPLMMLILLWAWYFTVTGFKNRRAWIPAGLAAGLLYLTKPTGHVFVAVFVVSVPLLLGYRVIKDKYFWYFMVFFTIGAFPLLARNVVGYGTPFYSVNQHFMWVDEWDEGLAIREQPNALDYIRTHDPSRIFERLEHGLRGEGGNVLRLLKPRFHPFAPESIPDAIEPRAVEKKIVTILLLLSPFAVPGRIFLFTTILFLGFFLPMSWIYWNLSSSYFLLAVYPLLLLFLSATVVRFMPRVPRLVKRVILFGVILLLALNAVILTGEGGFRNPIEAWSTADGYWELRDWFMEYDGLPARCVFEDFPFYDFNFNWHTPSNPLLKTIPYPRCGTFECLYDSLKSIHATHLIVSRSNMVGFSLALDDFLHVHPGDGITIIKDPGVWEPVFIDPEIPVSFIIFELGSESDLRAGISSDPHDPMPRIDLARFLLLCDRNEEAINILMTVSRDPEMRSVPPEFILSVAELYRRAGLACEAADLLSETYPLADGFESAVLYEIGEMALEEEQNNRAMAFFGKAAEFSDQLPSSDLAAAKLKILSGDPASAEKPLLRVLEREPFNQDALFSLACMYKDLARNDDAIRHLNLCRMVNPYSKYGTRATESLPVYFDDNGKYEHDSGNMYVFRPRPLIDSEELLESGGNLYLYEDGLLLWPAGNTGHDQISSTGKGRYSHWGKIVFFSSSDNSHPGENGRTYMAKVFREYENPYLERIAE